MSSNGIHQPCLKLEIDGMMCQKNCATTVQKAIKLVENVSDCIVTYSSREALIWGNDVSEDKVRAAIEAVGYDVVDSSEKSHVFNDSSSPDMILSIKGMFNQLTCPNKVENTLLTVDGVTNVTVNFADNMVLIWGFADIEAVTAALVDAGFSVAGGDQCAQRAERNMADVD